MIVEISVFDPVSSCVFCHQPPPKGEECHTHRTKTEANHIACNLCVSKHLENVQSNQNSFCPEECGYNFNRPKNCAEKIFRWMDSPFHRLAGCLKSAIQNPIVIMLSSGAASLSLEMGIGIKTSFFVLESLVLSACVKVVYDILRKRNSLSPSLLVGLGSPWIGISITLLSKEELNGLAAAFSCIAAAAPSVAIIARYYLQNQPIHFRYAMSVNAIASLFLFGGAQIGGAKTGLASAYAASSFGISTLVAYCAQNLTRSMG